MTSKIKEKNEELVWKEGDKERKWLRARAGERAMIKGIIPFYCTVVLQPSMPTGQERCWIHGQLTFTKKNNKIQTLILLKVNKCQVEEGTHKQSHSSNNQLGGGGWIRTELKWPSKLRMDRQEGNCPGAPDPKAPWRLQGVCAAITLC